MMLRILCFSLCFLLLSSCGLKSVYSNHAVRTDLACINMGEVDSSYELEITKHLETILPGERCVNAHESYVLFVNTSYIQTPMIISSGSDIERQKVTMNLRFRLNESSTGNELLNRTLMIVDSYNSFDTPYAAYAEEEMLKKNLALRGSEMIYHQLALFFTNASN